MRERKTFKRALAFLMSLLLTFTTLTSDLTLVTASAEENASGTQNYSDTVTVNNDNINVTKTAAFNDDGTVTITFDVTNKSTTQKTSTIAATDVVFVMDLSGSMDKNSKLYNAKEAAKNFAKDLIKNSNNVDNNILVGVAAFGTNGYSNKCSLTNDLTSINNSIDSLSVGQGDSRGTNIQAGLQAAETMLAADTRDNVKKIIVLLSDGVPTYSYQGTAYSLSATTLNDNTTLNLLTAFNTSRKGDGSNYTFNSYSVSNSSKLSGWYDAAGNLIATSDDNVKKDINGSNFYLYTETNSGASTTSAWRDWLSSTWKCSINGKTIDVNSKYVKDKKKTDWYYSDNNAGTVYYKQVYYYEYTVSNNGLPTISEAQLAKNSGIEIYTIGYDIDSDTNAKYVMQNVATKGNNYSASATSDSITSVLSSITSDIENTIDLAKGTTITDTFPSYMTVTKVSATTGTAAKNTDGIVNWELGENSTGTLTITAEINNKDAMYEQNGGVESFANGGAVKLNDSVEISYIKNGETKRTVDTSISGKNVPMGPARTYKYTVTYKVDGTTVSSNEGYAYEGKNVTVNDLEEYTSDTTKFNKDATTVTTATKNDNAYSYSFTMGKSEAAIEINYVTNTYDVTYYKSTADSDKVQIGETQKVHYGQDAVAPEAPETYTKNGFEYTFSNWDNSGNNITSNTEIYALYSSKQVVFDVTFKSQNPTTGAYETLDTKSVNAGTTVSATTSSVADVYANLAASDDHMAFNGKWYTDEDCTTEYDFSTAVNAATVLYAGYTPVKKTYTVQYYGLDGSLYATKENVTYGSTVENLSYTKGNFEDTTNAKIYFFDGWDKAGVTVNDENATNRTITVTAKKTSSANLYYTVTYVDENGTTVLNQQTNVKYGTGTSYQGSTPTKSATAQYTYTFDKWSNGTTDGAVSNVTADVTLTASYSSTVNQYTYYFKYLNDNGEWVTENKSAADYGTKYDAPSINTTVDVSANGVEHVYTFKNWSDSEYSTGITKNGGAEAVYDDTTYYQVTYNYNGKTATEMVKSGETASKAPTDTAKEADETYTYTFSGWGSDYSKPIEAPTTFTAEYTETYIDYSLDVHVVGAAGNYDYKTTAVHFGENATYTFDINTYNVDGKKYQISGSVAGPSNMTTSGNTYGVVINSDTKNASITITLEEEPKYQVIYHNAGLSVGVDGDAFKNVVNYSTENAELGRTEAVYAGVAFTAVNPTVATVSNNKYTYTFAGWVTADGKDFTATTLTSNVDVYPKYKETINQYTVTFMDGETSLGTATVDYGTTVDAAKIPAITTPEDTVSTHYLGGDNFGEFTTATVVYADMTVYAVHPSEVRKYTLTFLDWNGNKLSESQVAYNSEASAIANPAKADDARYSYTFKQWNNNADSTLVSFPWTVTGDLTVKAEYTSTEHQYYVTFLDDNNAQVGEKALAVWSDSANGFRVDKSAYDTLARNIATERTNWEFTYAFTGWNDATKLSANVTENFTVTAQFSETRNEYTITYLNEDGTTYKTDTVTAGTSGKNYAVKTSADTPVKAATESQVFTFATWVDADNNNAAVSGTIASVQRNYRLQATYTGSTRQYDVTYMDNGSVYDTKKADYNTAVSSVTRPATNPTKASVSENGFITDYTFASWDFGDVTNVVTDTTANSTYSAHTYPADPESNLDTVVAVTGVEETVNVFTNDSSLVSGTARTATVVNNAKITVNGEEVGTYSVAADGTVTATFTKPVAETTVNVEYTFSGTQSTDGTESAYSKTLTTPVKFVVGEAKNIDLTDVTVTYDTTGHSVGVSIPSEVSNVTWKVNGASVSEQPSRANAGTYTVTATGTYTFEGKTFTTTDTATLTINKQVITVSLPDNMTMVANEFAAEPDYESLATITGETYGNTVTRSFTLDASAKASNGRYYASTTPYTVTVTASMADTENFEVRTVNGKLTINEPAANTSTAGFYVLVPGALSSIANETEGNSLTVTDQESSKYTGKLFDATFTYTFSPYKSFAEYFGAHKSYSSNTVETTVDNYFTGNNTAYRSDFTYTYQSKDASGNVLNTYNMSNIDWYVLKDYSNSTTSNWNVDGYAKTINLVAKTISGKELDYTYTGSNLVNTIKNAIAADVNAKSEAETAGSYTINSYTIDDSIVNAGSYTVTVNVTYSDGIDETIDPSFDMTYTVAIAAAEFTVPDFTENKTYDGTTTIPAATKEFTTSQGDKLTFNVSTTAVNASDTAYDLTVAAAATYANYTINYTGAYKLNIAKKDIEVTVNDATKVYGDANPVLSTKEISGLADADTFDAIKENIVLKNTNTNENVGTYRNVLTVDTDATSLTNYNISKVNAGKLEITKAPLTVTVDPKAKVYGEADPTLTYSLSGLKNSDTEEAIAEYVVVERTNSDVNVVGSYTGVLAVDIEASNKKLANYEVLAANVTNGDFEITKATLNVTVKDASKTYGDADPEFEYEVSGLKYSDTKKSVGELEIVRTNADVNDAGTYTEVLTVKAGTTLDNYTLAITYGNFVINPYKVEIKKDYSAEKMYDGEDYVVEDETEGPNGSTIKITVTVSGDDPKDAGDHELVIKTDVDGDKNYEVILPDETPVLSIAQRKIVMTSADASKVYDGIALTAESVTFEGDGFVEGESVYIRYTSNVVNVADTAEGNNTFVYGFDETTKAVNYDITKKYGTLTVTRRPVSITADDKTKVEGEADPTLTVSVDGAVAGEGFSYYVWRYSGETAGRYRIVVTVNGTYDNYNVSSSDGYLTITEAPATVVPVTPTTPVTPATTPVTPTPTGEEETVEETETPENTAEIVEVPDEDVALANGEEEATVDIADEAVPEAIASKCWIHWLILAMTLVYALYAVLRAVQNKRELDDAESDKTAKEQ